MFTPGHLRLRRRSHSRTGRLHGFRSAAVLLFGLLMASALPAQTSPAPKVWRLPAGTRIIAKLRTSIDTRYTVVKSSVVAMVTHDVKQHGHVLLPKGTQLLGRVLESHPAQKGQPATLQVQFQQALLANGNTLPLSAGISSVFTRARRAALDRSNGIGPAPAPPDSGPNPNVNGMPAPAASSSSYRGSRGAMPVPEVPVTVPRLAEKPAPAQHQPGELRDSDGVPIKIGPAPTGSDTDATILTGGGPTIRLNAGTKIEIQIRHSVPVPEPADH